MPFFLAFGIVAIAVFAILCKTYVGYGDYSWWIKGAFALFLLFSISAPFIAFFIKSNYPNSWGVHFIKGLYFIFGFVFFLFVITFVRDLIWMLIDVIRRTPMEQIKNPQHLGIVNVVTLIVTFLVCVYGVFEAAKVPNVLTYDIKNPKIKQDTRVVMMSDLHIDADDKISDITKLVDKVNELNPDVVVLVGDIIDNSFDALKDYILELKKLKTKKGVYIALGNHEFYSGAFDWIIAFGKSGFNVLGNYGEKIGDTGIYIGGIPDINSVSRSRMKISIEGALYGAGKDDYVIMLSHTPKVAKGLTKDNVDMILSGHTHGGQIFPFHYFVKQANEGRLAGFYDVDGIKMYISRGTRYWGPPMRIGAPAEITVFDFKKSMSNDEKSN